MRSIPWLLCAMLIGPATAVAQRPDRHPCFLYAQTLREAGVATADELRERLRFMYVAARSTALEPASANLLKAATAKRGTAEAGRHMVEACRAAGNWTFGEARSATGAPVSEADALRQLQSVLERQGAAQPKDGRR